MEPIQTPYIWTRIEAKGDIPTARSGHTVVQLKGTMYIFGGFSGSACLKDFYALDLNTYVRFNIKVDLEVIRTRR